MLTSWPGSSLIFISLWPASSKSTLDIIVKYIVLLRFTRFVSVLSLISICSSSSSSDSSSSSSLSGVASDPSSSSEDSAPRMLLFRFSYAFSSSTKLGFARKTSAIKERSALHYTQLDLQSESSYYQCSIEEYPCSKTLLRLVSGSRSSSRDISCVNWSSCSTRSSSGRMAGKPYINGTKIMSEHSIEHATQKTPGFSTSSLF